MPDQKTEFDFPLTTPFTYSHQGSQVEATFIRLTAPTSRHMRECAALKQAFGRANAALADRAAVQAGARKSEQQDEAITGEDVILMMAASTVIEYPDVLDVAKKLFSGGVAMIDGETRLRGELVDRMSQDDFESMLGEYLVNFTLASLLEKKKEKSSPES